MSTPHLRLALVKPSVPDQGMDFQGAGRDVGWNDDLLLGEAGRAPAAFAQKRSNTSINSWISSWADINSKPKFGN